ncbi:Photosystem I assembly protein Ycf3, partial [Bienertia sinuspersici]
LFIVANILLRIIPITSGEKEAFAYYRDAQSEGNYAEALQNYYEAMRLEIDPYDRSYILYNIGLIHTSNGEHTKALEYYFRALERNPLLPQAFNNMAAWFDQAAEYWKQAITLTPGNYIKAHNWLKITGRFE